MKEMIMSLIILIGAFAYIQVNKRLEVKRAEQQEKARKMRELRSQIKLQRKRDEFEAFQRLVETYDRDCEKCFEEDYTTYLECHPGDYNGKERKKHDFDLKQPCKLIGERDNTSYYESYMENKDNEIRNLRVTLQDFTVEEVMHLYSL